MDKKSIEKRLEERMMSFLSLVEKIVSQAFKETLDDLEGKSSYPLSEEIEDPKEEDYWNLFKSMVKRRLGDLLNII